MMRWMSPAAATLAAILFVSGPAFGAPRHTASHSTHRSSSHSSRATHSKRASAPKPYKAPHVRSSAAHSHHTSVTRSDRCHACDRDEHGRIVRSGKAKDAFKKRTGYPHGRPGYVIDHIVPLACGGSDLPSNMQWQARAAAKAKDRTERSGCHR